MIEYVLIVARSGRMLAEAARAIGLKPLVVDCYGDIDTRTFAESVIQVDALDVDSLEAAAVAFKNRFPVEYALYGSGLETVPECIDRLAAHFRVLGNAYRTLLSVQNKALFFETLSKFKIPHPEVSMIEPSTREGWLVKPPRGEGGIGIYRFGTKAPVACSDVYWQRWVEGIPGSALFLADGRSVKVIGYNVQWTRNLGPEYEFCFVGMMNESPLTKAQSVEIRKQIEVLVRAFGLVGLNSLDFIVDGGNVWILEINARPSAGMQLYGHDSLSRHIDACLGRPLTAVTEKIGYCGYRIVFAETDIEIPNGFPWPEDCRDLPRAGLIIRKGRPVCSIISRDSNPKRLFRNLLATERIIINHLEEKGL